MSKQNFIPLDQHPKWSLDFWIENAFAHKFGS